MRRYNLTKISKQNIILCLNILMWLFASCDTVQVRETSQNIQSPALKNALRAKISAQGLRTLYTKKLSDNRDLLLEADIFETTLENRLLHIGPLNQLTDVFKLDVELSDQSARLTFELRNPVIYLPTRMGEGADTRICRWKMTALRAVVVANISTQLNDENIFDMLGSQLTPNVQFNEPKIEQVTPCHDFTDSTTPFINLENILDIFEKRLLFYTTQALADSVKALLTLHPIDELGLINRKIDLTRLSSFESRRGQMRLSGQINTLPALELSEEGLITSMDYAVSSSVRAGCIPPAEAPLQAQPALIDELAQSLIDDANADYAMIMTLPLFEQLAVSAMLSGFACRGLYFYNEDSADNLTLQKRDLFLSEVNIDDTLLGDNLYVSFIPGAFPNIGTGPNQTLNIVWEDLSISLYAEVFGAMTQIASLTLSLDADFRLIPSSLPRSFSLDIQSMKLWNIDIKSDWISKIPPTKTLENWARLVIFATLEDAIILPLLIEPDADINLTKTQVRDQDIVFFMKFN